MTVRDAPRPPAQRKADALVQLQTPGIDVWVATAGTSDDDDPRGTPRPPVAGVDR